jgi:hypothetical protein
MMTCTTAQQHKCACTVKYMHVPVTVVDMLAAAWGIDNQPSRSTPSFQGQVWRQLQLKLLVSCIVKAAAQTTRVRNCLVTAGQVLCWCNTPSATQQ